MTTDRATIELAAQDMDRSILDKLEGPLMKPEIVDTDQGPCNINAIHSGYALLEQIAKRSVHTNRRSMNRTIFAATLDGRPIGAMRFRSIFSEFDCLSLYGVGVILPEELVTHVEPLRSGAGTIHGVRFNTRVGVLDLRTAPGMRSGRRI